MGQKVFVSRIADAMAFSGTGEPDPADLVSLPSKGVYIGKSEVMRVPVFWSPEKLINPHIAIVGITGSGKSFLVKTLITRMNLTWDTNALILDWVGEYRKWVVRAGGKVIDASKEGIDLMQFSFGGRHERVRQIMSALDTLLELKNYPETRDAIEEAFFEEMDSKSPSLKGVLSRLSKKGMKKAMRMLEGLALSANVFSRKSSIDIKKLCRGGLVCIDLHTLPSEEIRSLVGLTILQYVKEHMRTTSYSENAGINLVVVLDEAWKLASSEESDVIDIIREGRKYGFALLVATQNPTDIHKVIFSNAGTVFVLRLVLREFRDYVLSSLEYGTEMDGKIASFGTGAALLHMAFSYGKQRVKSVVIDRIDGEDQSLSYVVSGEGMKIEIEKGQMTRMLLELGLDDSQIRDVKSRFAEKDGEMGVVDLIIELEKFGFSRSAIMSFLRKIGASESAIISSFSLAKVRRTRRDLAALEVGEE